MERLSSTSRSAIYKISQIIKTKQIARRWHKLATITAMITGIKHVLLMKGRRPPRFPYPSGYGNQSAEEAILLGSGQDPKRSVSGVVPGDVPEGHLAVYAVEEERVVRFVIPVGYLKHPLFMKLLHKAEDEFGFNYRNGGLTLPCDPSVLAHIIHLLTHGPLHHHRNLSVDTAYQIALQNNAGTSSAAWAWPDTQSHSQTTICRDIAIDMKGKSVAVHG